MFRIQAVLTQLKEDEKGTSALGYALLAALVAFILVGAAGTLGANLGTAFASVANSVGYATVPQQAAAAPAVVACRPSATVQCRQDPYGLGIAGYPEITG